MGSDGTCQCLEPHFAFYEHCVACLPGCAECPEEYPTICTSCEDGYYLEEQFCYQCPEGCLSCSSPTVCGSCASTYEPSGQECVRKCNFPCQTCPADDPDVCESCVEGYTPADTTCAQTQSCTDSNCMFCPASA
jgi:proprotein convertase subtilisin/kexin type 5